MIAYTAVGLLHPSLGETLDIITASKLISTRTRPLDGDAGSGGATPWGAIEGTVGKRASSEEPIYSATSG
jgi:hypothetical protein